MVVFQGGEQTTPRGLGRRCRAPPSSRADGAWSPGSSSDPAASLCDVGRAFPRRGLQCPLRIPPAFRSHSPVSGADLPLGLASPSAPLLRASRSNADPREAWASFKEPHSRDQRLPEAARPQLSAPCRPPSSPWAPAARRRWRGLVVGDVLIPLEAQPHTHLFQT